MKSLAVYDRLHNCNGKAAVATLAPHSPKAAPRRWGAARAENCVDREMGLRRGGVRGDSAKQKKGRCDFLQRPLLMAVDIAFLEQELQAELEDAAQVRAGGL